MCSMCCFDKAYKSHTKNKTTLILIIKPDVHEITLLFPTATDLAPESETKFVWIPASLNMNCLINISKHTS